MKKLNTAEIEEVPTDVIMTQKTGCHSYCNCSNILSVIVQILVVPACLFCDAHVHPLSAVPLVSLSVEILLIIHLLRTRSKPRPTGTPWVSDCRKPAYPGKCGNARECRSGAVRPMRASALNAPRRKSEKLCEANPWLED